MKRVNPDELANKATAAALEVIDTYFGVSTHPSRCELGDKLAYGIHDMIEKAIYAHMRSEFAPAGFVLFEDQF